MSRGVLYAPNPDLSVRECVRLDGSLLRLRAAFERLLPSSTPVRTRNLIRALLLRYEGVGTPVVRFEGI